MSPWRRAVYAAVTVLMVLAVAELALGLAGVRPLTVLADPYVGFAGRLPLFVQETRPDGTAVLTTAPNKTRFFNRQTFLRDKPAGAYRIFCLGGSTTYGHPYDDAMSFCGWLRRFLQAADPSRAWEVINAGGISYASYRITALMEELAGYQPDLFIVYSGHNEFIEERTYREVRAAPPLLVEAQAVLGRSRLFSAVQGAVSALRQSEPTTLPAEVSERLARTVGPEDYHRDDSSRAAIIAHYRVNLARMTGLARAAGSDIAFVMPSSNLRDMSPFKSEHRADLAANDARRWDGDFAAAQAIEDPGQRLTRLEELLAVDHRYAALHYERGRALLTLGRADEAEAAFRRALDEDIVPLRMLPEMTAALRAVAAEQQVPLIDFTASLEERTRQQLGHAILGNEWFVDHVHLSIDGYRLLGLELVRHLQARGVLTPSAAWTGQTIAALSRQAIAAVDAATHGRSLMNLGIVLAWAGRLEEGHRLLLEARRQMGDDLTLLLRLGHSAERLRRRDQALEFYEQAAGRHPRAAEPHRWLADLAKETNDRDGELRHRQEVVRLSPASAADVAALAELLAERGDWAEAARRYQDLAGLRPDDAQVRLNLGIALASAGQADAARRQFEEARRLDPASPDAYLGLAGLHDAAGEAAPARALYAEAVKRAPDNAMARLNLGASLAREGRLDEAIGHFREAVRIAPDGADAHTNLAVALRQRGRLEEAQLHFEAARRLSSGSATNGIQ